MEFTFNSYSLTLIYCGTITLFISYYVYNRDRGAVRWFGLMMLANAIWSLGYGFELASSTLTQIKTFINIEYIGIVTLPLTWFFFCLKMTGKDRWFKKRVNLLMTLFIPAATLILVWSNTHHHIHYKGLYISHNSDFPMAVIVPGIGYRIFTIYFYLLLGTGSYLLISKFRKADPVYKKQNYSILVGALIPWMANISYLLGYRPLGNLDVTPFAFIVTIFLISIGIYRFRLFDILPVAREKVLELMQDGFIILDQHQRIIDYNHAFLKYFIIDEKIIGKQANELFGTQPNFMHYLQNKTSGKLDLKIDTPGGVLDLEADITYMIDDNLNSDLTIVKFQDQTAIKKESLKIKDQAAELQKLNQLKDRIFSIIAHDLRAPLVNLSEVLKMISNDIITPEEFKMLAPILSKDIIYTTDLLENILHWSRSQLKGYGINKEYFNLRNLIINEIDYHQPPASIKEIKIVHNVFPNVIVFADMLMIQIVVRNIINNAIKFSNTGGIIDISASYQRTGFVHLLIEDKGIGMPAEVVQDVFGGANISTRGTMHEKGTGLGLMICKEFMQRNDGDITAESEPGKGTIFTIKIPVEPVKE